MKYKSNWSIRLPLISLFILMIIRDRIQISYESRASIPAWLEYSDIFIFFIMVVILSFDWKRMRLFYQNQESEDARKYYRREIIINWVAVALFVFYFIWRLFSILNF